MSKSFVLTENNINTVIKTLKKSLNGLDKVQSPGLLINEYWKTDEIDRNKYRGKGRPRLNDYIYQHYTKYFKSFKLLGK